MSNTYPTMSKYMPEFDASYLDDANNNSCTTTSIAADVVDGETAVSSDGIKGSLAKSISMIMNFVNASVLGRPATPVVSGYFNNVLANYVGTSASHIGSGYFTYLHANEIYTTKLTGNAYLNINGSSLTTDFSNILLYGDNIRISGKNYIHAWSEEIEIYTPDMDADNTGSISITTGNSDHGTAGNINITAGYTTGNPASADSGSVNISAIGGSDPGNIILQAGNLYLSGIYSNNIISTLGDINLTIEDRHSNGELGNINISAGNQTGGSTGGGNIIVTTGRVDSGPFANNGYLLLDAGNDLNSGDITLKSKSVKLDCFGVSGIITVDASGFLKLI